MRTAALLVALFVMVVGVVGLVAPESLMGIARYVVTPLGLAAIGTLRILIGLVLIGVAPVSRVPRTLRVIGAVIFVAGLATPLFGVDRTQAVIAWEAAHGINFVRGIASLLVGLAGVLAFAVTARRNCA